MDKRMQKIVFGGFLPIVLIIVLFMGFWIHTSNKLNNEYQDCQQQWSQVENMMQRRYDLIPNLTASVKGSMKQEQKVFGQIADARSDYASAKTPQERMKADTKLDKSTNVLIKTIHEQYPELASNNNVRDLMTELEGSENRISTERQNYIATVRAYNQTVTNFPSSIVANAKGDHSLHYYKASSDAQSAPKVNLE